MLLFAGDSENRAGCFYETAKEAGCDSDVSAKLTYVVLFLITQTDHAHKATV